MIGPILRVHEAFTQKFQIQGSLVTQLVEEVIVNVLAAVVRYFGGTKLGTGGLARAYRRSAAEALQKCGKKELLITEEISLSAPLGVADRLLKLADRMGADVKKKEFGAQMKATFAVPVEKKEKFLAEVENLLRRAGG